MPLSGRPSIGKSRGNVAPVLRTVASNSFNSFSAGYFPPTSVLQTNLTPSASICLTRRRTTFCLSSFMLGMPYINSPPGLSARSNTVTLCPARFNCAAALNPAGPEPMTATFFPVRVLGASATTQPSSQALSIIAHSMLLMATGGFMIPRVQEPSQGAGQTRPVNSGKLLVLCRRSSASRHRPRYTRSFHSGIRLFTGQPLAMPLINVPV